MIKNVVFDIGNVLVKFEPDLFLKERYSDEKVMELIYSTIFTDKVWLDLDRGTIEFKDAIEYYCKKSPSISEDIRKVMDTWLTMLTPVEGTDKVIIKLKENGYKIFLLSNYHRDAFEYIYNKYDFLRNVDGMVISSTVNMLKPEKEIYKELINKYNLLEDETIFIDDTIVNVEAAKEIGIHGIVFTNSENLEKELKEKYCVNI